MNGDVSQFLANFMRFYRLFKQFKNKIIMAETKAIGNDWDGVMTSILDKKQYFDADSYVFKHELDTMDMLINKSSGLM